MSLTTLTFDPTTIDDDEWTGVESLPSLDDWLRLIWGVRPGVSSARCTAGRLQPSCVASAGWLQALWGFAA